MGKFFDTISGNKDTRKATKRGAAQQQVQDFSFSGGGFGNAQFGANGGSVSGGPAAGLVDPFAQFAQSSLAQAGQSPTGQFNIDPMQAFQQAQAAGNNPQAQQFTQAGQNALSALGNFDPNAFAGTQLDKLNALAARGEENQTQSTVNRLFGSGRLGGADTQAGSVLGQISPAQDLAQDQRSLSAIGLANQEQNRLAGFASSFANTGQGLQSAGIGDFLQALQGGQGQGNFLSGMRDSLLGQSLGATQGINQANQPALQAMQIALSGAGLGTEANLARGNTLAGFDATRGAAQANKFGSSIAGGIAGGLG